MDLPLPGSGVFRNCAGLADIAIPSIGNAVAKQMDLGEDLCCSGPACASQWSYNLAPIFLTGTGPIIYHARMKWTNKSTWIALLFLLPNLAGFLVFLLFPIALSFIMAFTNWSLKPAVEFEFVGLRNFSDILGLRPVSSGHTSLLLAYLGAIVLTGVGFIAHLWAAVGKRRGMPWGGLLVLLLGAGMWVGAFRLQAGQGIYIAGAAFLVIGLMTMTRDDVEWRWGLGMLPAMALLGGVVALAVLHGPMWTHYEVRDLRFWQYFYNTLYLMLGLPVAMLGSLALALLLNEPLAALSRTFRAVGVLVCVGCSVSTFGMLYGMDMPNLAVMGALFWGLCAAGLLFNVLAFRTMYYLPTFTAGVALMVLWKALYNPESGPINISLEYAFSLLGVDARGPRWLASVVWAKPALIIMGVWTAIGGMNMLLYLAGLSTVSKDLMDAAKVDGAGRWMRFRHVIWPHLAPTTFFILIISIIGGLQGGFEQARVMTLGGPAGATTTLSYYIYNIAFGELDLGRASAISWVLFAFVFAVTAVNWKFGKGMEIEY